MNRLWGYMKTFLILLTCLGLIHCGHGVTETCNPGSCPTTGNDAASSGSGDIFESSAEAGSVDDPDVTGTDDENTGDDTQAETSSVDVEALLVAICTGLSECYSGVNATTCQTQLNTDANLLDAFGASSQVYSNFDQVQTHVDSGVISVETTEYNTCRSAIDAVSCTTMESVGAYDASASTDYSDVYKMLPEEC